MSEASVTSVAPCLIRSLVPAARVSSGDPAREHLAALFGRHPRRDREPERVRGLHHDDAERASGNRPVAAGKIARPRLMAERHLGNRAAASIHDDCQQVMVLWRIDPVVAAGQRCHRAAGNTGAMCGLIDATREARDDDETRA